MNRSILFPLLLISLCSIVVPVQGDSNAQFVDATREAGISFTYTNGASEERYLPETMGSGAAFFDYDNDGFLDLYIVNGRSLATPPSAQGPINALYRNSGNGTFTDVTQDAGVGDPEYGMRAAAGDYDNDGDADLYVTNFGPNTLYRNEGNGGFADVTEKAGVGDPSWSTNASFVDYDGDGDLDLYVANYADFDVGTNRECLQGTARAYCGPTTYPGQSGVLYRNDGNGPFEDVTRQSGLFNTSGRQLGAVFGDCDDDGDLDLFVANDKTPNFLFENSGDGTFTETGLVAGVAYSEDGVAESAMGADLGDYDNDGRLDIIVATFQWLANTLYHNDGGGFYTDVTFGVNLGRQSLPYLGMTAAFLDYDNDGFLDIFVANGHLDENVQDYDSAASYAQKNQLFRNEGNGKFSEVTAVSGPGLQVEKVSHGAAFGDYDNDGDWDIFVSNSASERCTLLRNDGGNRNNFLMLKLNGTRSNRDGIGARIRAQAGDLVQMREVRSSYGYLSSNDRRLLLGLGQREGVDQLEIRWPSGTRQMLANLPANQILTITEERP